VNKDRFIRMMADHDSLTMGHYRTIDVVVLVRQLGSATNRQIGEEVRGQPIDRSLSPIIKAAYARGLAHRAGGWGLLRRAAYKRGNQTVWVVTDFGSEMIQAYGWFREPFVHPPMDKRRLMAIRARRKHDPAGPGPAAPLPSKAISDEPICSYAITVDIECDDRKGVTSALDVMNDWTLSDSQKVRKLIGACIEVKVKSASST
jgi:hypothetical protein